MLDLFFKRYVWLANAAFIFVAAWLTARTVNTVVGVLIRPRAAVDLAGAPTSAPTRPVQAPLELDKLYALIGQKPPAAPVAADEPAKPARAQNCADTRAAPVKSALRAQLVGATLADPPRWSLATLTDLQTRETRVYGVGDAFQGARLIGLERLRDEHDATGSGWRLVAVLCNEGQKEYVDFEAEGGTAAVAPIAQAPVAAPAAGGGASDPGLAGIKKTGENQYEVPRAVIDNSLSNLNQIATQARIVPSFKNGVANGFKLFSIQPNSLYSSIGLENGDVIQRINGYEMNSPDKALEIYQRLRTSPHVSIEFERNGRVVKKEYNIGGQ